MRIHRSFFRLISFAAGWDEVFAFGDYWVFKGQVIAVDSRTKAVWERYKYDNCLRKWKTK